MRPPGGLIERPRREGGVDGRHPRKPAISPAAPSSANEHSACTTRPEPVPTAHHERELPRPRRPLPLRRGGARFSFLERTGRAQRGSIAPTVALVEPAHVGDESRDAGRGRAPRTPIPTRAAVNRSGGDQPAPTHELRSRPRRPRGRSAERRSPAGAVPRQARPDRLPPRRGGRRRAPQDPGRVLAPRRGCRRPSRPRGLAA